MSEWKPGDVAMVRWKRTTPFAHTEDVLAIRQRSGDWFAPIARVTLDEDSAARPLVVIDPEDDAQVEILAKIYTDKAFPLMKHLRRGAEPRITIDIRHALQRFAESAPTPPSKPAEPLGLGAVVEDVHGLRWVRVDACRGRGSNSWSSEDGSHDYEAIAAVRVLSEGVE